MQKAGTSEEAQAFQAAKEGKSMRFIAENFTGAFARRHKGIQAIRDILKDERKEGEKINGLYIYGETGAGKTTFAVNYSKKLVAAGKYKDYFLQQPKGNWFDGYDGQEILILNEIGGGEDDIKYKTLLAMFDPYTMELPVKGSFIKLRAKLIILTSNLHIDGCFTGVYAQQGQLKRRMNLGIIKMKTRKEVILNPVEYEGSAAFEAAGL